MVCQHIRLLCSQATSVEGIQCVQLEDFCDRIPFLTFFHTIFSWNGMIFYWIILAFFLIYACAHSGP